MLIRMNTPLLISAAAVVVAALVAMGQVPALFGALGTPRLAEDKTTALLDEYLADHEADLESYRKRFDGRSFFFKPRPPRRERAVRAPTPRDDKPEEVKPAGPPKSYTGPTIIFVLGNEVFFHGGLRLRVGDEEKEGVTVIASNAPWSVTLEPISLYAASWSRAMSFSLQKAMADTKSSSLATALVGLFG